MLKYLCDCYLCIAGSGVSVFSLHPGVVQSDLWRHQHQCIQVAVKIFRIFTKTTVEGAQTTIYCAVEPSLESLSGGYFRYTHYFSQQLIIQSHKCSTCVWNSHSVPVCVCSDCAPARCSRTASNDDLAQKLWEVSCNILGITWQWTAANYMFNERHCILSMNGIEQHCKALSERQKLKFYGWNYSTWMAPKCCFVL